jgi:hypothetical protein
VDTEQRLRALSARSGTRLTDADRDRRIVAMEIK